MVYQTFIGFFCNYILKLESKYSKSKEYIMTLTEQLKAYAEGSAKRIPEPAQNIMKKAVEDLISSSIITLSLIHI